MNDFLKLYESGYFYDNTDLIEILFGGTPWNILCETKGTGMSTFISTFSYYLDYRYKAFEVFSTLKVSNWIRFRKYMNRCVVIRLDFSDFSCTSYPDAIAYFRRKMSDLYKTHFDFESIKESYLEIIEEKCSESGLSRSLYGLINELKYRDSRKCRENMPIALLIDNLVLVEKIAYEYDYHKEMLEFLEKYCVEDIYHYCEIFLMVGELPAKPDDEIRQKMWWREHRYFTYHGFSISPRSIISKDTKQYIVPNNRQHSVADDNQMREQNPSMDWEQLILECHRKLKYEKEQERIREAQRKEAERTRYKLELNCDISPISRNLGVRHFEMNKDSDGYRNITVYLEKLYGKHCANATEVYECFQQVHTDEPTDIREGSEYYKCLYFEPLSIDKWSEIRANTDSYWNYFSLYKENDNHVSFDQSIKLYVSFHTTAIKERFISLTERLILNLQHDFSIKVSRYNRMEHMCIWIAPKDYSIAQSCLVPLADELRTDNPFMIYDHGVGICREFGRDVSYNSVLSHLMFAYFQTINKREDISVEAIFNMFAKGWNGDLEENNPLYRECKSYTAKSLVLVLDTMDVLSNGIPLENTAILFDDKHFWNCLEQSHCWADVNDAYTRYLAKEKDKAKLK